MPPQPLFPEDAGSDRQVHLRILATTDLHAHVLAYDYYGDKPSASGGLARLAPLIEKLRQEAPNVLLFENGDLIQGTPLGDYVGLERGVRPDLPHPVVTALNHLRFDAATVGNHEFNYGLDTAMQTMAGAEHPVVLSNVFWHGSQEQPFAPYVLLRREVLDRSGARHALTIGVVGFTPPQILNWDRSLLESKVEARDITRTAEMLVPQLREQGADLVVALCHSGIGGDDWADGQENAAVPLGAVPGIDAVITGHTHKVFPGPDHPATQAVDPVLGTLNGTPAVMSGFWGSHVGVIDLALTQDDSGRWQTVGFACEARAAKTVAPAIDTEMVRKLDAVHRETVNYIRRPIGSTRAPLQGYFAMVSEAPTLRLVQEAQTAFLREAIKGTTHDGLPILSAASPFKSGGPAGPEAYTDIAPGPLALKHAADLYPFPNSFSALRVNGDTLREWLERSAGAFARLAPGTQDGVLLDCVFPSYDFDVIWGVEYQIDLSQPARYGETGALVEPDARRITTLRHNGKPIAPAQEFIVATHSYRVGGGGSFTCLQGAELVIEETKTTLEILIEHIGEANPGYVAGQSHWGFAPMPGTSAVFDTGPEALQHLNSAAHLDLKDLGLQPSGFQRFRLNL